MKEKIPLKTSWPCSKQIRICSLAFTHLVLHLFLLSNSIGQQKEATFVVKIHPSATKPEKLYLATDLNEWNPRNSDYKLSKVNDSTFSISLPLPSDGFEFKFTQGTWGLTEGTLRGEPIINRRFSTQILGDHPVYQFEILGWERHHSYQFIIQKLPENTPHDAAIYLTGNFNNWNPANPEYKLIRRIDGVFETTIYTDLPKLEYKFTRGNWASVEARENGKARPNRTFVANEKSTFESIPVAINGWEDLTGSLHLFSIVDLLLLFSVFQGFLLIVAIPTIQTNNREANKWLLASLGISSVMLLLYTFGNYQEIANRFPKILLLSDFILFIYGPLYYFYLVKLLFKNSGFPSRWYWHFLAFGVQLIVYLPFLFKDDTNLLEDLMNQDWPLISLFTASGFFGLIWNIYYWRLFKKTVQSYQLAFQTNFSDDQNLNYLQAVSWIQLVTIILWSFFFLLIGITKIWELELTNTLENLIDFIWLSFSLIPFFIGYYAIHQPETFKASPTFLSIFDDVLDTTVSSSVQDEILMLADEEQSLEDLRPIAEKLQKYMDKNRPYTNPKLSLTELANQLKTPPHVLSKVINDVFGKNFFDFINSYRIEAFKTMLQDNKNAQFTLLSLAYEVGFNSKTAFNRSFKKHTDLTPREYLEELKKETT